MLAVMDARSLLGQRPLDDQYSSGRYVGGNQGGRHTHGTVYPPGKLVANAVEGNPAVLIVILLEAETTPVAVAAPEEETITD